MTRKARLALFLLPCLAVAAVTAADVIAQREAGFKASKRALSTIRDALASGDHVAVAAAANGMAGFAEKIPALFPPGSQGGIFSAAKDEIWRNAPDFSAKAKSFQTNAQALAAAASAPQPDKAAIGAALTKVTQDCKSCHQTYKKGR
ncbi:MAG: cytochrome c [Candidatus Dactylopiibacterium sp.]|nr:cytochrome c [Candidatus Dactylopiibacterium sp.]